MQLQQKRQEIQKVATKTIMQLFAELDKKIFHLELWIENTTEWPSKPDLQKQIQQRIKNQNNPLNSNRQ